MLNLSVKSDSRHRSNQKKTARRALEPINLCFAQKATRNVNVDQVLKLASLES